jgi:hypothetical protein
MDGPSNAMTAIEDLHSAASIRFFLPPPAFASTGARNFPV